MTETAILKFRGKEYELSVKKGSVGPDVIDITNLYKDVGVFTYDPAFMSTASCESKITFVDGEKGILQYRGYHIADLAKNCDFMDVSYLLLHGDLPDNNSKKSFINQITYHSMVHEQLHFLFRGFNRTAHPMSIMVGAIGSLSSFYHDSLDVTDPAQRELSALRLIAKVPTLGAIAYNYTVGQPFMYPQNDMSYIENMLYMIFATPCEKYRPDPVSVRALDKLFTLHADHEQNASTSTMRIASSSGANPFACIAASIASLWGPAHGGANEAVIRMLEDIGDEKNIPSFIARAKDKSDPFKLMGFGHRVYKSYDPRAAVLRDTCYEVLEHSGKRNDPLFKLALELEKIALADEYFIERKLYPNVDFYSGIIYRALGIPINMFTVMFAIARTVGWVAQWTEMMSETSLKIARPRQLYTGEVERTV